MEKIELFLNCSLTTVSTLIFMTTLVNLSIHFLIRTMIKSKTKSKSTELLAINNDIKNVGQNNIVDDGDEIKGVNQTEIDQIIQPIISSLIDSAINSSANDNIINKNNGQILENPDIQKQHVQTQIDLANVYSQIDKKAETFDGKQENSTDVQEHQASEKQQCKINFVDNYFGDDDIIDNGVDNYNDNDKTNVTKNGLNDLSTISNINDTIDETDANKWEEQTDQMNFEAHDRITNHTIQETNLEKGETNFTKSDTLIVEDYFY